MLKFGSANHRQKKINKAKVHSFPKRESFIIFIHFSSVRERERVCVWETKRELERKMKYLEGRSTGAAEQGASDPISSGVDDDDDAEGRASDPMNLEISICCLEWASERSDLKRRRHWKEPVALSLGLDWILVISFFFLYFSDFWNTALKWNTLVFSDLDL